MLNFLADSYESFINTIPDCFLVPEAAIFQMEKLNYEQTKSPLKRIDNTCVCAGVGVGWWYPMSGGVGGLGESA